MRAHALLRFACRVPHNLVASKGLGTILKETYPFSSPRMQNAFAEMNYLSVQNSRGSSLSFTNALNLSTPITHHILRHIAEAQARHICEYPDWSAGKLTLSKQVLSIDSIMGKGHKNFGEGNVITYLV